MNAAKNMERAILSCLTYFQNLEVPIPVKNNLNKNTEYVIKYWAWRNLVLQFLLRYTEKLTWCVFTNIGIQAVF